jgi:hypothetical protein
MKAKIINYILNTPIKQIYADWREYKHKKTYLNKHNKYIELLHTQLQHTDTTQRCIKYIDAQRTTKYCKSFSKTECSHFCPKASQHNLYKTTLNKRNEIEKDISMHWLNKLQNIK